MTEPYAIHFIASRANELGWEQYDMKYRDFSLKPGETRVIPQANSEMFVLVQADPEVGVRSEMGIYDKTLRVLSENAHEHSGEIELVNHNSKKNRNVAFIQVFFKVRQRQEQER